MAYSFKLYNGDGNTTIYPVNIPYIEKAHVKVYVDGVDTPYEWLHSGSVQLPTAPPSGSQVKVKRETPREEPIVDFQSGTNFTERELDMSTLQMLYVVQEAYDTVSNVMGKDDSGAYDAAGNRITNLEPPVHNDDAVNLGYLDVWTTAVQALHDATVAHEQGAAGKAAEAAASAQAALEAAQILESTVRTSIPDGGTDGQIPVKQADTTIAWQDVKASIPGGTPGQKLVKQADGSAEWEDLYGVPASGRPGQVLVKQEGTANAWQDALFGGLAPGLRNQIIAGRVKDGLPAYLVGQEFLNMEHENNVKHSKVGTVSASSIYNATYNEVKPLRNQVVWQGDGWVTPEGQRAGWWQYDFTEEHVLTGLYMTPRDNNGANYPKDWELQGWNGSGWDVIYSRTNDQGLRGHNSNAKTHGRMYWFTENTKAYKRIRLNVMDTVGVGNNFIDISVIRFYEAAIPNQHKYDVSLYATPENPFMASVACGFDAEKRPVDKPFKLTAPTTIDGHKFAENSRNYVYLVPAESDGSLPANLNPAKATQIEGQNAYLYTDVRQVHYGTLSDIENECLALLQSRHEVDYDPVPAGAFEHSMGKHGYPLNYTDTRVFTVEQPRGAKSSYQFAGGNNQITPSVHLDKPFKGKNYHPYTQNFTMEIDFKFEGPAPEAADNYYIIFDSGYNSSKGFSAKYYNRHRVITLYWNNGDYFQVPFDASDRAWHTLAVTKKGSRLFIHVDGKCLGAYNDVPDLQHGYRSWMLGRWLHTNAGGWIGYLNNFRYTLGSALYQGEDYTVTPQFSTSLIPHETLWYDAGEGVVKEWDAFTETWTATPMLPIGHVETGFKEHLMTDQPRGTYHLQHTKWVDPNGYSCSAQYDSNHVPESLFNFGHGGQYPYATSADNHTTDHFVQFTLEEAMSFEELRLCNTNWRFDAYPAKFILKGSNDGTTWNTLVDRSDGRVDDGGHANSMPKVAGDSHYVGYYKRFPFIDTTPYKVYRLELPAKGDIPIYGAYGHTAVRMTMTFAGAKPEVEEVTSYAIGGTFSIGPIPIDVNQEYRFEVPFGGMPFDFVGYVEEQYDFENKRRLLGQGSSYHNGTSWAGQGECVHVEPDAVVVQTFQNNTSIYSGTTWNSSAVTAASTQANLYLTAKRRW